MNLVGRDDLGLGENFKDLAVAEGIADLVTFHGGVDHGMIQEMNHGADVCILTSRVEGIPVVLMEAMASGTVVVGPRITGVPELVVDGETGLLIDPESPASVAGALMRLATDDDLRLRLSKKARSHVEANYDMRVNAERLAGIFDDFLLEEGQASTRS